MASKNQRQWMHFGEFFEEVTILGINEGEAAEALLAALQSKLRAFGYRRRYHTPTDDRCEILPRDVHPQPVPTQIWRDIGEPGSNLCSRWVDDPEDPEQFIHVDWVSGDLQFSLWEFLPDLIYLDVVFRGLRIEGRSGRALLSDLAGQPAKKRGSPTGSRNHSERDKVRQGIDLKLSGDPRNAWSLAKHFTDRELVGDALEKQTRRIYSGIRAGLIVSKK